MTVHWIDFRWRAEGVRKRARSPIAIKVHDELPFDIRETAFFRPNSVLDWLRDDNGPVLFQEDGQLYRRISLDGIPGSIREVLAYNREINPLGFIKSDRSIESEIQAADLHVMSQIYKSDREDVVRELTRIMAGAVLQTRQNAVYIPCPALVMTVVGRFVEGRPALFLQLRPELDPFWVSHSHWMDPIDRKRLFSVPFSAANAGSALAFGNDYLGHYQALLRRFPRNPMEIHPLVDRAAEFRDKKGYGRKPLDGYETTYDEEGGALRALALKLTDKNMQHEQMQGEYKGPIVGSGEPYLPTSLLRQFSATMRAARGFLDGDVDRHGFASAAGVLGSDLRVYADNGASDPWSEEFANLYAATIDATFSAYPALLHPVQDEDVDLDELTA